jgi:hypothetical protein
MTRAKRVEILPKAALETWQSVYRHGVSLIIKTQLFPITHFSKVSINLKAPLPFAICRPTQYNPAVKEFNRGM